MDAIMKFLKFLGSNKSYLSAIAIAVIQALLAAGVITPETAQILTSLAVGGAAVGLRHAITTTAAKKK